MFSYNDQIVIFFSPIREREDRLAFLDNREIVDLPEDQVVQDQRVILETQVIGDHLEKMVRWDREVVKVPPAFKDPPDPQEIQAPTETQYVII